MLNSLKLCQALNEKICHDFAGSIGAIDNAIGLIKTIEYQEKATKLVQDSTNRLMRYLQFYRYLYSLASEGNKIAIAKINRLSTDFLKSKNHNIELVFTRLISTNIDDNIAQIIMCLIVTASSNIYRDAVIKVELEMQNDNFTGIKIVVIAPNLRLDQGRADILLGNRTIDDVSIENVHEYYTYYLITEYGYKLAITPSTDSVEYIYSNDLKNWI